MLKEENITEAPTLKHILNWRRGKKEKSSKKAHVERYGRQNGP